METRNQRLIRELLNEKDKPGDHSLRKHAWNRARDAQTPKTLTPWEWQQWYAEHGVPENHKQPVSAKNATQENTARTPPWWRRLLSRLSRKPKS